MRWLKPAVQGAASLSVPALLGLTAFIVVFALVGRSLPFTGGFTSSDEPLSFDRLVTRASERSDSAEEIPAPTPTPQPKPEAWADTAAPSSSAIASAGPAAAPDLVGNAAASTSLQAAETSTETKGATTVTWESSFADLDYTLGDTLTMTVNWEVESGAASYDSFVLKGDTPTSERDPAAVTNGVVTYPGANGPTSVDVSFAFTELHLDAERKVEIGNGYFKLYLRVDTDGDGRTETLAGYGVNIHVEHPL